jgi:hypothetical protein
MEEQPPTAEKSPPAERRDEEGLPLDREPTFDDVRGGDHSGRKFAVGCTALVVLVVAVFWVLRMLVLR